MNIKYFNKSFKATALGLACASMLLQPVALAVPQSLPIMDVALQDNSSLLGQVTSDQGQPLAGTPVLIMQRGKEIARVSTDQNGDFAVQNLHGGIYQVVSIGQQGVFRLWAPHTAPPVARQALAFQADHVIRAQGEANTFTKFTSWVKNHPLMTGGIIATAIAIPFLIDNDDDDSSS
jgi:hypothetical protein